MLDQSRIAAIGGASLALALGVVAVLVVLALVVSLSRRRAVTAPASAVETDPLGEPAGGGRTPQASARRPPSPEAAMLGLVATDLATLDLPQLLASITQQLATLTGVTRCAILLAEGESLHTVAATGSVRPSGHAQDAAADTILSWAAIADIREPLTVTPATRGADRRAMVALRIESALVLPLIAHGRLLGIVSLDDPGAVHDFGDEDVSAAMTVASFAAIMVNNAQLFDEQAGLAAELRGRSAASDALLRLGNQLRATLDLDEVLATLGAALRDALGYREVTVYLRDVADDTYVPRLVIAAAVERAEGGLAAPVPSSVFARFMRPEQRMGNSFFSRRDRAGAGDEPFLPRRDLGSRRDDEWQTGDVLLVPVAGQDGAPIGVIDVYDPVDRRIPSVESVRTLEIFANQAVIAIQNALQYERLQQQEGRLERELRSQRELLRVSESMLASLDEKVVFDVIADTLAQLVAYDTLAISKVDREAGLIHTVFARDEYADELIAMPMRLDEGITGWVVTNDADYFCNAVHEDPRGSLVPGTPLEPQASIILPLRVMNNVIGVLDLDRLGGTTFSDEEFAAVRPFANLAAIAIENASLYERSRERAITDALTGLYNHGNFQETLEREVSRCERYGEVFTLLMMDLDHFKMVNDRFGHPRGDEVLKEVADIVRETSRDSDYAARYGGEEFALLLPRTTSAEGSQLAERLRERIVAISVVRDDRLHVSASVGVADFPACGLDAKTVLSAADTALLWAKRRGRNCVLYYRDVREMMVSPEAGEGDEGFWTTGLEALAAAVDAKATFRERHSEAVAGMVRELATAAGCDPEDIGLYETAARLHDVGKLSLPTEILAKGGDLTVDELEELKRHVDVGVDILKNADAPRELFPAVRHHHERWDGFGYPDGLCGEDIPLGARLIAICDAFQAMLSDRPYRPARTLAEARDEIARGAGGQFDPRFARLFLDACRSSGGDAAGGLGTDV